MKTYKQKKICKGKMPCQINLKYLPKRLTSKDKKKQSRMLLKSKKMYKKGNYYTRKPVRSFMILV